MGKPAARITDMHVCPMATPGVPPLPHVGGPITGPGVQTVLIGGMPAAVMGDMCTCTGPPDTIILGSTGVLIGGKPAARLGDPCAHGGTVTVGCPTVLIGEANVQSIGTLPVATLAKLMQSVPLIAKRIGQMITLREAARRGSPFCERCPEAT